MQIASGWSKGLKILTPAGTDTRPTRGRVRASALNMLQPWIADARVMDLFAGSGAVGLELLSRGAAGCHFIENAPAALKCLKVNMEGLATRAVRESRSVEPFRLIPKDAQKIWSDFSDGTFDLIWADPPYDLVHQFMSSSIAQIERLLSTDGVFALESSEGDLEYLDTATKDLSFTKIKQRAYGVSLITIWQKSI